jgi:hypothetical protein
MLGLAWMKLGGNFEKSTPRLATNEAKESIFDRGSPPRLDYNVETRSRFD